MKHFDFIRYMAHPGRKGSSRRTLAACLLLGALFLVLINAGTAGAGITAPNCNRAQMEKCGGCAVGAVCCAATDPGSCLDPKATSCAFTKCGDALPGHACDANACTTVKAMPHCTKTQLAKCSSKDCAEGSICCPDTGKCSLPSAADCKGLPCGDTKGVCSASACTVGQRIPDCTQAQMTKCGGCATGVICCADKAIGGCAAADAGSCKAMSCGDAKGVCNSNACSTVDMKCPSWNHIVTFKNNMKATKVWIAAIPGCRTNGTCAQNIPEPKGGWGIEAGQSRDLTIPACWSGGFIIRENCSFTLKNGVYQCDKSPCCEVGDCLDKSTKKSAYTCNTGGEPPVTRIEVTFDGGYDSAGVKLKSLTDYYDISYVDGWTKMATMEPTGTKIWSDTPPDPKDVKYWCKLSGCASSTVSCPDKLVNCKISGTTKTALGCWSPGKYAAKHKDEKQNGQLLYPPALRANLGCKCDADSDVPCDIGTSTKPQINPACNSANNTTFGCSPYSEPGHSNINSQCCPWLSTDKRAESCGWNAADKTKAARAWPDWAKEYVSQIKGACPNAYAWQYDDLSSTYKCQAANMDKPINYLVNIYDVALSSKGCK